MKLRIRNLSTALGSLLGLFVGLPVILGYSMNRGWYAQMFLGISVVALVSAAVLCLRPGLAGRMLGKSALGNLLRALGAGGIGTEALHVAPEPVSAGLGFIGVGCFCASLVVDGRRGASAPGEATP